MKTRRLEIACERESVDESASHAIGFVSSMIVSSDAGVPPTSLVSRAHVRTRLKQIYLAQSSSRELSRLSSP